MLMVVVSIPKPARMDHWHLSPGHLVANGALDLSQHLKISGLPAFGAVLSCLESAELWNKAQWVRS